MQKDEAEAGVGHHHVAAGQEVPGRHLRPGGQPDGGGGGEGGAEGGDVLHQLHRLVLLSVGHPGQAGPGVRHTARPD